MPAPDYTITIKLKDVAEGDATTLAQSIWDEWGDAYDAKLGDFSIEISRAGFPVDWVPEQ